jgi:hypothetical protein
MSAPSIRASVYSWNHPLINGENAPRLQSVRTFDPSLSVVNRTLREANELHAGRPASLNSGNGGSGDMGGFAGLNPQDFIMLETGLRQVDFRSDVPNTSFYDTIENANRSNWPSQYAGHGTMELVNGPESYTNVPVQPRQERFGVGSRPLTMVERQNYARALKQAQNRGY